MSADCARCLRTIHSVYKLCTVYRPLQTVHSVYKLCTVSTNYDGVYKLHTVSTNCAPCVRMVHFSPPPIGTADFSPPPPPRYG